ncbi:2-oxo-tetronate isomerase [Shinella sp. BYT-45]|uniref:2-oxo-tetronate isomerase n=1 Tax=Shinella sp. BYT-45 TaxID=3377377 RepID=UPI0039811E71
MPRFAANLSMMFGEVPFLDRFQAAADAGFEAVEFLFPYDYPPEAVAEALRGAGLRQVLFNLPPGDWARGERGLAALPERASEFRQSVGMALDYARVLDAPNLHMMAGLASPSDPAAVSAYLDALRFAADAAGKAGRTLLIEPINRRDMPGYFLDDFGRAAEFVDRLGHPYLKFQFDIYHRQILHGDVLKGLAAAMPVIGHVQIASVPERHEPGTGELDDFRIFAALDALGYEGWVGCEYRPAGGTPDGLGWLRRARAAAGEDVAPHNPGEAF